MNYSALIQNRKSVREFTDKQVFFGDLDKIRNHYNNFVRRLMPEIKTELRFFGTDIREALEGAAGYNKFLVGAPQYMVLLSEAHKMAHMNAGYIMEDMVLKLTDMDIDSCWVTFTDSEAVKAALDIRSELDVVAIVAFGYGKKTVKRLRLNILSMSNVDVEAKHRYMEPKRCVQDLAFVERWGNSRDLDKYIGFFDDMLWEALYAASLAPSYLNRQAYGFLLNQGGVYLVRRPDKYTTREDGELSLGIVLHHFSSVAENWMGKLNWSFYPEASVPELPEGHQVVALCSL
jgi:hypothetical protein